MCSHTAQTSFTSPLQSWKETCAENVFISKSWMNKPPSPSLSPSVSQNGISSASREILVHRCVSQYSGVCTSALYVKYIKHEMKVKCSNFSPGAQTSLTLIWERNSCLNDVLRNTWVHSQFNKCECFSLDFEVQTCGLQSLWLLWSVLHGGRAGKADTEAVPGGSFY